MKKAILLIDFPKCCGDCPFCDEEHGYLWKYTCYFGDRDVEWNKRDKDCPLIPLTEYEEAQIKEIISEKKESEEQ